MLSTLLASDIVAPFSSPKIDYHALAPELVLAGVIVAVLLADLFLEESKKWVLSTIAGFGMRAAFIPIVTLAVSGHKARSMFGGVH